MCNHLESPASLRDINNVDWIPNQHVPETSLIESNVSITEQCKNDNSVGNSMSSTEEYQSIFFFFLTNFMSNVGPSSRTTIGKRRFS